MLKNPCYNAQTKTDCPKRCVGCASTCPDWERYLQERDDVYQQRRAQVELGALMSPGMVKMIQKKEQRKIQTRVSSRSKHY